MLREDVVGIISYAPLWETLKQKNISQYKLIQSHGISRGTLDALRKNRSITLNTVETLCNILNCEISDIVKVTKEEKDSKED